MACAYFSRDLSNGRYDTSKPSSLHFCEVASTDVKASAVTTSFGRTMAFRSQENFILVEVPYRNIRMCITSRIFRWWGNSRRHYCNRTTSSCVISTETKEYILPTTILYLLLQDMSTAKVKDRVSMDNKTSTMFSLLSRSTEASSTRDSKIILERQRLGF